MRASRKWKNIFLVASFDNEALGFEAGGGGIGGQPGINGELKKKLEKVDDA